MAKDYEGYGCIYKITCVDNGKVYIGQTIQSCRTRFKQHVYSAHHKDMYKNRCSALCNAIESHGENAFSVEIVCVASNQDELDSLEKRYIKELSTMVPHGYNLDTGGKLGRKYCSKSKMSIKDSRRKMWGDSDYASRQRKVFFRRK